jgi:hypothetical protein
MKTRDSWIAIVGLSGILTVGAAGQETGNAVVIPEKASVTAEHSQKLAPFQVFKFQLHFYPAPDYYGGGTISASFKNEGVPPPSERFSNQSQWRLVVPVGTDLHDGQAIYSLELSVRESMLPGKWKLAEVSLGRSTQKIIPISEDISFVVAELEPLMVHVQAPSSVEAGNEYAFTVSLARFPTDISKNCKLHLWPRFKEGVPNGRSFDLNRVEIVPGQLSYKFSHKFEPDFPSGPWEVVVEDSAYNSYDNDEGCWYPQLQGNVRSAFKIEPAKKLVTPTSVAVTVNPSQIELLREEADRLRAKERHLREQLASEKSNTHQVLLQTSVKDALTDLERTKNKFVDLQKSMEPSSGRAVYIFFDDIERTYVHAQESLAKVSARLPRVQPGLRPVHYAFGGAASRLDPASDAVLESIVHNAAAYDVVASSKSLTFTLEVDSRPKGATISYKLRGDDYRPLHHETDWRIENLPRAVYLVRVQLDGYVEQEKIFDAIKDTGTGISFDLKPKSPKP